MPYTKFKQVKYCVVCGRQLTSWTPERTKCCSLECGLKYKRQNFLAKPKDSTTRLIGAFRGKPERNNNLRSIWSKIFVKGRDECWPWEGPTCKDPNFPYGYIQFEGRRQRAHRIIWSSIYGQIPDEHVIRHTCDNPPCCNPAHLLVGTQFDNVQDRVVRCRHRPRLGEQHPSAKLKNSDINAIRARLLSGDSCPVIARQYGVTRNTIWYIKDNKTWRSVPLTRNAA
jgi:hypothetical protein